jgi:hypothetical protein
MKKILGIVALTLIAGAPAFALDTTAIDYVLQVGGSNAGGPTVPFDTTNVKEEGDPGIYDAGTGIVTWSVKVLASGGVGADEPSLNYIRGVSNLVWDLTLLGPDGQPVGTVGTPFGLGSATTAGFYSSIQDGTGLYKLQPAAFTWVFGDAAPFGRLNDVDTANGANAVQYTFPSTYSYYRNDVTDAVYNTTATVLAPTGTLKGMGAGFQDFDIFNTPVERAGIGILSEGDPAVYECFAAIGEKAPIAEGQINLTGLPSGTYTLVLTPGAGNNVIWADGLSCQIGTSGAFAIPAKTVTGSSVSFTHTGAATGSLVVNLAPDAAVAAGCTWSVDGGAAQISGATVAGLTPGSHVVSFNAVAGWTAPANVNANIVASLTTPVGPDASTTFIPLQTPIVAGGVVSRQFHGGSVNAYRPIQLFATTIPTTGNVAVESRRSTSANVWTIDVTFDLALGAAPTVTATGTNGNPTLGAPTVAGNVLSIPVTAFADRNCISFSITNVTSAAGSAPNAAPYVIKVVALQGDVNGNRQVNVADVNLESTKSGALMSDRKLRQRQMPKRKNRETQIVCK